MTHWKETTPTLASEAGQGKTEHHTPDPLERQLQAACDAMRAWRGDVDLPSNPLLLLARDRQNRDLLKEHRDLALEVAGRILGHYLPGPMLRDCWRTLGRHSAGELLGLDRDRWPPRTTEAVLLRELTARFVEAGVLACV